MYYNNMHAIAYTNSVNFINICAD